MRTRAAATLALVLAAVAAASAHAAGIPRIAALQVGLQARGLYSGAIDGIAGPETTLAVRRLQRRARIPVDGVAGPQTRRALGPFGRHVFGTRLLRYGSGGWDVAVLQFELATHGFPSGAFDGSFGPRVEIALRRFQRWASIGADGIAGPATWRALGRPAPTVPLPLSWPLTRPVLTGPFGPTGDRFHAGIDLAAPTGTSVYTARSGRVVYASWAGGGWGLLVVVDHGHHVRTFYAHLSKIDVLAGVFVGSGVRVGAVGATGKATGPHLHFEVRVDGAAVDPRPALP